MGYCVLWGFAAHCLSVFGNQRAQINGIGQKHQPDDHAGIGHIGHVDVFEMLYHRMHAVICA